MDKRFDLFFSGEILPEAQLNQVKANLAQLFKADSAKVEALFSGKPVALKRNLDTVSAKKYQQALTRAGAKVLLKAAHVPTDHSQSSHDRTKVVDAGSSSTEKSPEQIRAERLAAQNERRKARQTVRDNSVSDKNKTLTMAERLAQQATKEDTPVTLQQSDNNSESGPNQGGVSSSDSTYRLAPAGADLLEAKDRIAPPSVHVDTSALRLEASGGDLLHDDEKQEFVSVDVDTSAIGLSEPGADLLTVNEREVQEPVEVDVSSISLSEAQGDLLNDSEKRTYEQLEVDTSSMSLAPPGSDMGQLRESKPEVQPDISKLSLSP